MKRSQWLMFFNCQAEGLAACLTLLNDTIEPLRHEPSTYSNQAAYIRESIEGFDRVLVAPELESQYEFDLGELGDKVIRLPPLRFEAYHPDLCYLRHGHVPLRGPCGLFHSAICHAAFQAGLDAGQALALYREDVYAQLGYLDAWDTARSNLESTYRLAGLDIGPRILDWSRRGPFMHSVNHPKIHCLLDLASLVLQHVDLPVRQVPVLPHDNLANGASFPVFPEIGERLAVRGSYRFKPPGRYTTIGLEQFVSESYALYRSCGGAQAVTPVDAARHARLRSLLEAGAA